MMLTSTGSTALTIFDTQPTIVPSTLAMGSRIDSSGVSSGVMAPIRLRIGGSSA